MNISDDRALPDEAHGTWLTANTFSVLRQPPLLGRDFTRPTSARVPIRSPSSATPSGAIAIRADPAVLGHTLRINGRPTTIVGVMPDGMRSPDNSELWPPYVPADARRERTLRQFRVFGRLLDGVDRRGARAE